MKRLTALLMLVSILVGCAPVSVTMDRNTRNILKRHLCVSKAYYNRGYLPNGNPLEEEELSKRLWLIEHALESRDLGDCKFIEP